MPDCAKKWRTQGRLNQLRSPSLPKAEDWVRTRWNIFGVGLPFEVQGKPFNTQVRLRYPGFFLCQPAPFT